MDKSGGAEGLVPHSEILGEKANAAHDERVQLTQLTPDEVAIEKKLCWKIDVLILPVIMTVYLMNYIDRNNYAAARLQGLERDLNRSGDEYQVGLSVLFVGCILMQVPSNLLLNYTGRPSWYLEFFTCAWGLVSACTSQVNSYGQLVTCRLILGLVSALISGAFGNLIAGGILNGLNGARGLSALRWLYIIEGSITVFTRLIVVVILPDFPDTWRALSPEMKHIANRRLAIEPAEADMGEEGGMSQLLGMKLAFLDPKTYILTFTYHAMTGGMGFQNFFPTLTATLDYNRTISLLLMALPYIFITLWSFYHSWLSDRAGNRFWFFMYPVPLTIAGAVIFMTTNHFGSQYFSFFLLNFVFVMNGPLYAWISTSIPRPSEKRAAALAFINSVGNAPSIWTPFTYFESQGKNYPIALGIVTGLMAISGICGIILRLYLQQQNRQLTRLEDETVQLGEKDLRALQKAAEVASINIVEARNIQKDYRYLI